MREMANRYKVIHSLSNDSKTPVLSHEQLLHFESVADSILLKIKRTVSHPSFFLLFPFILPHPWEIDSFST